MYNNYSELPNNNRKINEDIVFDLDLNSIFIIDVRNNFELGGGYLKSSTNIPFSEIITIPSTLPHDKIIFTYCNYGNRAGKVALALFEAGYNAYSLGGYSLFSKKLKNLLDK